VIPRRIGDLKERTLQAELGVVEAEGGRVGRRQQRPASFLDVERDGGRHQVGHGPLGGRHDVQRPHALLHRHAHQNLARRPPRTPPRVTTVRGRGPGTEAGSPDAGEQVRQRLGTLLLLRLLVPLLLCPAPVERRRQLLLSRGGPRRRHPLPLPAAAGAAALVAVRRRCQRRHRRAGRLQSGALDVEAIDPLVTD